MIATNQARVDAAGAQVLNVANQLTVVANPFTSPSAPVVMAPGQIADLFGVPFESLQRLDFRDTEGEAGKSGTGNPALGAARAAALEAGYDEARIDLAETAAVIAYQSNLALGEAPA
ncbi:MAG: hypothetical protein FJX56_10820 [Alphaproteobacteria bacterium]|nr:hypothetical protein [Alphaproteobacteria bacterium]